VEELVRYLEVAPDGPDVTSQVYVSQILVKDDDRR
jgi:hypothetical protein